ncbi:MAG TPA: tRNA epoxyqueuosine(34) reductase QueG [Anaerolineae bacterium]|nr:tRNA epoxyqueuosine(34) reductase QueG [Anaerolineae bacterium]HQH38793.1 tRNA epoxyqueuosine(34) reductase QueG [Anaerolineae bacterium]
MSPDSHELASLAADLSVTAIGVAQVGPTPTWAAYQEWLAHGYAGDMDYLARPDAVTRRADPRNILPETRTVLVIAASYAGAPPPALPPLHGRVSRYAWGADYHAWLLRDLETLVQRLIAVHGPFPYRCYVDTGPILERAWAQAAGLGWSGKNANLIHPRLGSYLFLGVALLGLELEPMPLPALPDCGTCTRCLDACHSGALVAPGVLDARRCIAYLTVEHRGAIPPDLRPLIGDRVFGCDTCQEVCPWNRQALALYSHASPPPTATLDLPALLTMSEADFRTRFRHTPVWRAAWRGLARNAAVVLGNRHDPAARDVLAQAAAIHPDALIREHAAWALTH